MSNAAKSRIALWLVIAGMCCIAFALGEWRGMNKSMRMIPVTVPAELEAGQDTECVIETDEVSHSKIRCYHVEQ